MRKESRRILPLKNGRQIEAGEGLAILEGLKDLLKEAPQHFRALFALANGHHQSISGKSLVYLRHCGFLKRDTLIVANVQNILVSGFELKKEGQVVVVNPFRLESAEQAEALQLLEKWDPENLLRLLHEDRRKKGGSP